MCLELIYYFRKGSTALSGRTTKLCSKHNRDIIPARLPPPLHLQAPLTGISGLSVMGSMKEGSLTLGSDEGGLTSEFIDTYGVVLQQPFSALPAY